MKAYFNNERLVRNLFFALTISLIYLLGKFYQQRHQQLKADKQKIATVSVRNQ